MLRDFSYLGCHAMHKSYDDDDHDDDDDDDDYGQSYLV